MKICASLHSSKSMIEQNSNRLRFRLRNKSTERFLDGKKILFITFVTIDKVMDT